MKHSKVFLKLYTLLILGAVLTCLPYTAFAQNKSDKVKAVFLFKFFDYVTWPQGKIPGENNDGVLCTYGKHSFGDTLEYIAARKSGKYRLRTKVVKSLENINGCHVLYMAGDYYKSASPLENKKGVLLVSDSAGILNFGGVIELYEEDGKVGLIIDLQNAKKKNLKISSRLLDIAKVQR